MKLLRFHHTHLRHGTRILILGQSSRCSRRFLFSSCRLLVSRFQQSWVMEADGVIETTAHQ